MLRFFAFSLAALLLGGVLAAGGVLYGLYHFGRALPDYKQLADYEPPVTTRVHAGDGTLVAEYAVEQRVFVPIGAMPRRVIQAFLSAEDKTFYQHSGIDIPGIIRAVLTNVMNFGSDRRLVGASTITQQVAKNFLLSNEVSLRRKVREAILALRIERAFTKDRILELYLNEIYLGYGSYGVAAAALNYFNKSLDDLTLAEAAYLASLPKAPNNYHPIRRHAAALARRNWVLGRMQEDGFITDAEAQAAMDQPLVVRDRDATAVVTADYFAEEVRRELVQRYGEDKLYEGGLSVRTTLDPHLQAIADRSLRNGLIAYDRRHGWRGPLARIALGEDWAAQLAGVEQPAGTDGWYLAAVLAVQDGSAEVGFVNNSRGSLPLAEVKWARQWLEGQKRGPAVKSVRDVLAPGDIVLVEPVTADDAGKPYPQGSFALRQVPDINGAVVAMDPHTGRVLAMTGGFAYSESQFNRATQALRQPGSAFKPFVYLAALESGYTPSTLILDAPYVIDQGPGLGKWKPANYTNKFYGPSTMRLGIEKSRNLMTVRLASAIGMERVADFARRFNVVDDMPLQLSMALGAGETTLLRLTTAYAELVNGGLRIQPSLIDRIQDRNGHTVYRHDDRACPGCDGLSDPQAVPAVPDSRERLVAAASAYQVVSMLEGVVKRGTGRRISAVGKPLAGKTGTTNDSTDTWFIGFSPDLAVGVFAGFDQPRSLGGHETGSNVAAPVFKEFMTEALVDQPAIPFRVPQGIRLVRVNSRSGRLAQPGERGVILEAFKPGSEPSGREDDVVVLDGGYIPREGAGADSVGGLY